MTEVQKEQIRNLSRDGLGYKKIASMLDLSENTVKSYCRRCGIKRQKFHEAMIVEDVCRECGTKLYNTAGHRQRVFCSSICRQKYWKEHQSAINRKHQVVYTCPVCGRQFIDYANRNRRYCSLACYHGSRKS